MEAVIYERIEDFAIAEVAEYEIIEATPENRLAEALVDEGSGPFSSPGVGNYPWQLAAKANGERVRLSNNTGEEEGCRCACCGCAFLPAGGAWAHGEAADTWRCHACWAGTTEAPPFATRELAVPLEGLACALRVLEAVDDYAAQAACEARGEEEAFGSRVWPTACACAERVLQLGVSGKVVLELGCGCGVIALAALRAGAELVIATDRAVPNLQLVAASAKLQSPHRHREFLVELFDVTMEELPFPGTPGRDLICGNRRTGAYRAHAALHNLGIVAFSDCLYWAVEARAFGKRAAQAVALGATVVVADPNTMWQEFLEALLAEAVVLGIAPPVVGLESFAYHEGLFRWISLMSGAGAFNSCEPPRLATISPRSHCNGAVESVALASTLHPPLAVGSWRDHCDLRPCLFHHAA